MRVVSGLHIPGYSSGAHDVIITTYARNTRATNDSCGRRERLQRCFSGIWCFSCRRAADEMQPFRWYSERTITGKVAQQLIPTVINLYSRAMGAPAQRASSTNTRTPNPQNVFDTWRTKENTAGRQTLHSPEPKPQRSAQYSPLRVHMGSFWGGTTTRVYRGPVIWQCQAEVTAYSRPRDLRQAPKLYYIPCTGRQYALHKPQNLD